MFAIEAVIIQEAIMVDTYWYHWLEVLQEKRSSYGCTDVSLELNLEVI